MEEPFNERYFIIKNDVSDNFPISDEDDEITRKQKIEQKMREYAVYDSETKHWKMRLPHWFTQSEYEFKTITVESFSYFKPDGTLDLGTTFHSNTLSDGEFAQYDHMISLANDGIERTFFIDGKNNYIEFWFKDYLDEECLGESEDMTIHQVDDNKNLLYWKEVNQEELTKKPLYYTTEKNNYPILEKKTGVGVRFSPETGRVWRHAIDSAAVETEELVDFVASEKYCDRLGVQLCEKSKDEEGKNVYTNNYYDPDGYVYMAQELETEFPVFDQCYDLDGNEIRVILDNTIRDEVSQWRPATKEEIADPNKHTQNLLMQRYDEVSNLPLYWLRVGTGDTVSEKSYNIENIEYENIPLCEKLDISSNYANVDDYELVPAYVHFYANGSADPCYDFDTGFRTYYLLSNKYVQISGGLKYTTTCTESKYRAFTAVKDRNGHQLYVHERVDKPDQWLGEYDYQKPENAENPRYKVYTPSVDGNGQPLYYHFYRTTLENTGDPVIANVNYKTVFIIVCKLRF